MSGLEALLAGRTLAERYRIEEVIGRGGMGAVYRAKDERLGRPVALKVITAASGSDAEVRERMRARFRHEAASAGRLPHHPNVVPVYDYGTDPTLGLDFIVMELLRGEDLATRLARSGPPALGTSLRILREAARGVAVGHRAGLVHRDVKPGNIFLAQGDDPREMQVRVLDFGIAKAIEEEDTASAFTHDGRAPLSPAYASPEQLRNEPRLSPASDVFSLGALAFQLCTGQRPFTDADRNRMSVGMEVPLPSLRARNPAVPEEVDALVRRALAFDPAERFPTAGALADALDEVIRQLPTEAAGAHVPAASAAPLVTDHVSGDDDRTVLAGRPDDGDRTMVAPPPRVPVPPAAPVAAAPAPVIPARRPVEPEPRGGMGKVLAIGAVLLVLGGGGVVAYEAMNDDGRGSTPALTELPDSAVVDSAATDTTLVGAAVLSMEGRRMLQERNYPAAAENFRRALEADPTKVEYRDGYAFALLSMGRAEEAEKLLLEAIRDDRNYDLLYSHLADARIARGDTTGAISALERFIDLTLNREDQEAARRKLESLTPVQVVVPPAPAIDSTAGPLTPIPVDPGVPRDTIRLGTPRR